MNKSACSAVICQPSCCEQKHDTYTKVKPTTRILAMGSTTQINLDHDQLVHCVKYNILFFCQQTFFWKKKAMNTLVKVPFTQTRMRN